MVDFIIRYWVQASFVGITSFVGAMFKNLVGYKKTVDILSISEKSDKKNKIYVLYDKYMALGYMPLHEKENLQELHSIYLALPSRTKGGIEINGSHLIQNKVDELLKLPDRAKKGKR